MSIPNVILDGYGPQASIAAVILDGFSIGSAPAVAPTILTEGLGFGGRPSSLCHMGYSCYLGLPEPPITGKQYQDINSLTYQGLSLLLGDSSAVLHDVFVVDQVTQTTNYPIVVNTDGTGYVSANGDLTRQKFTADIFDVSMQANLGAFVVEINDNPPVLLNPLPSQFNYPLGGTVNLDFVNGTPQYVLDPDGDQLTMTQTGGALPPGLTIAGTSLLGNVTAAGTYNFQLTFADPVGSALVVPVTFYVYGTITMPDLTGDTQTAAAAQLVGLGLVFAGVKGGAFSNTIPIGNVAGQSVPAGSNPAFGTFVTLSISLGPSNPFFPFILLRDAISAIVNAGLIVNPGILYAFSSVVPAGCVISQSPSGGADVLQSTQVYLTVSSGPATTPGQVTVPNLVGSGYLHANHLLSQLGLGVANIVWAESATVPGTYVISQSVAAGTQVAPQTPVVLTVSSGPNVDLWSKDVTIVPDVLGYE